MKIFFHNPPEIDEEMKVSANQPHPHRLNEKELVEMVGQIMDFVCI